MAYRTVKEMTLKRVNCAGSKAFNKVMLNTRPPKSKDKKDKTGARSSEKEEPVEKSKNPAEAHFLKAQGAVQGPSASAKAPAPVPAPCTKSREERMKEKLEARRAAASEKDKRAAAIREKLAAKRAKKSDGDVSQMPDSFEWFS